MKILITGASGFLGTYLREHLQSLDPRNEVRTICRNPIPKNERLHSVLNLNDEEKLVEYLEAHQPQQIYHLAGVARISNAISAADYFQNNTQNTVTLLRALMKTGRPVRLFFSSSVHVYGNQSETVSEASSVHPLSPYAFTKYLAEKAIKAHVEENPNLTAVVGRIYSCFGPGQAEGFVAADLCRKILDLPAEQGSVLKVGPLKSYRRFLDVRDIVSIFPKLLEATHPSRFEIFNLASPHEFQIETILQILIRLSKKQPTIESTDNQENQFQGLKVSTEKLHQFIPHDFFRPVEETLKDMLVAASHRNLDA